MTDTENKRISARQVQEEMTEKLDRVVESTNDALEAVNEKVDSVSGQLQDILLAVQSPSFIRKHTEPMEEDLGETVAHFDESQGSATLAESRIGDVDSPEFKKKTEMLSFMEEPVTVHIHDTAEKNADRAFNIGVNGRNQTFVRNEEYTVPRKFVEGLARAKPVHYENDEYTDHNGVLKVQYNARRGLRYGFSVVQDDSPYGKQWLKSVLAQP